MYFILSSREAFFSNTLGAVYDKIKNADFDFNTSEWNNISDEAKDLITCLLTVDIRKRYTCQQAMNHPWFKKWDNKSEV